MSASGYLKHRLRKVCNAFAIRRYSKKLLEEVGIRTHDTVTPHNGSVILDSRSQGPSGSGLAVLRQIDTEHVRISRNVVGNASAPSLGKLNVVGGCENAVSRVCSEVLRGQQNRYNSWRTQEVQKQQHLIFAFEERLDL
jgi:hypothetical protein